MKKLFTIFMFFNFKSKKSFKKSLFTSAQFF